MQKRQFDNFGGIFCVILGFLLQSFCCCFSWNLSFLHCFWYFLEEVEIYRRCQQLLLLFFFKRHPRGISFLTISKSCTRSQPCFNFVLSVVIEGSQRKWSKLFGLFACHADRQKWNPPRTCEFLYVRGCVEERACMCMCLQLIIAECGQLVYCR